MSYAVNATAPVLPATLVTSFTCAPASTPVSLVCSASVNAFVSKFASYLVFISASVYVVSVNTAPLGTAVCTVNPFTFSALSTTPLLVVSYVTLSISPAPNPSAPLYTLNVSVVVSVYVIVYVSVVPDTPVPAVFAIVAIPLPAFPVSPFIP